MSARARVFPVVINNDEFDAPRYLYRDAFLCVYIYKKIETKSLALRVRFGSHWKLCEITISKKNRVDPLSGNVTNDEIFKNFFKGNEQKYERKTLQTRLPTIRVAT